MSVKCNICGFEKQFSIVEHLKFSHNLNSKQYKELYTNALVKSKKKLNHENKKDFPNQHKKIKHEATTPSYRFKDIRERYRNHISHDKEHEYHDN